MRILLTVHQFLPKYTGDTELLTFHIGRELIARGHEVHVLASDQPTQALPAGTIWDYEYRGLKVRLVAAGQGESLEGLRREFDDPEMAEHMRAYIKIVRPQLIHVMHAERLSGSIIPAAKEFGIPIVFTAMDFWSVCWVKDLRRADTGELCWGPDRAGVNCLRCFAARTASTEEDKARILGKSDAQLRARIAASRQRLVRNTQYLRGPRTAVDRIEFLKGAINATDRVIAPTRLARDVLIRNGIDPTLIEHKPYGTDTSDIRSAPRSPERPPETRIAYIGPIAEHQGVDVLVEAFRGTGTMAKARLDLYGDPNEDPGYYQRLAELSKEDPRIYLRGTLEIEKTGWVLSEVDVLVVPLIRYENVPLVVYSAFASGTPVVATNLGGLPEVIEHGHNGLLFSRGDVSDLNAQLQRLLFEPELLPKLRRGTQTIKTAIEHVDELEKLYGELV